MELKTSETGKAPRFKMEFIIAVSAIVVSVMSMVVAIYQTQIMRDQQHTAVWPYIQWMMQTGSNGFSITVTNKGVGPAIIKSTSLKLDGKPMQNVDSLLIKIFGKLDGLSIDESEINNQVIAAGEEIRLFHVFNNPRVATIDRSIYARIQYEICFCSIYNECWTSKSLQVIPSLCD